VAACAAAVRDVDDASPGDGACVVYDNYASYVCGERYQNDYTNKNEGFQIQSHHNVMAGVPYRLHHVVRTSRPWAKYIEV
jgi:hypothetical protein